MRQPDFKARLPYVIIQALYFLGIYIEWLLSASAWKPGLPGDWKSLAESPAEM